jgi:glycosyltransferase involved in cell wall biosynthesis
MIYFLAEHLDSPDGASRAAHDILTGLLELEHDVVVVTLDDRQRSRFPPAWPISLRGWIVAPEKPARPAVGASPRQWLRWGRLLVRYARRKAVALRTLRRLPPVVAIHNEFPDPGSFAHRVLHSARRRLIVVHSTPECIAYYLRRRKVLTVQLVAAELAEMHGLLFVSPQLRDAWGALAPIADIPQWVLSNTCRETEAAEVCSRERGLLREALGLPRDAFIVACVGFVHDGKGQDTIVSALPGMVRLCPELMVVFVGADHSEWAGQLKETIASLGLTNHTHFAGRRPDPYAFIRAADLLIHASRTEGQGLVLLEAMLLHTPVLATNVGGIPFVITDGETGLLMPPSDPAALLEHFRMLVTDPTLRAALADRAEESYWQRFSRAQYDSSLEAVTRAILTRTEEAGPVAH